jgi:hypothetical protein
MGDFCLSAKRLQEEAKQDVRKVGGFFGRAKKAITEEVGDVQPKKTSSSVFASLLGGTKKVAVKTEEAAGKQSKRAASAVGSVGRRAAAQATPGGRPGRGKAALAQGVPQ